MHGEKVVENLKKKNILQILISSKNLFLFAILMKSALNILLICLILTILQTRIVPTNLRKNNLDIKNNNNWKNKEELVLISNTLSPVNDLCFRLLMAEKERLS